MPKGYIDRECETCGASYKGNQLRCNTCLKEVPRKMFKYRIYPNKAETARLEWTLEKCRKLYNAALSGRQRSRIIPIDPATGELISKMRYSLVRDYEATYTPIAILDEPVTTNKGDQSYELTHTIKRDILPEYQEIGDHILRDVINRVDLAFQAFLKRNKEGVGYPKFKGQKWYNSFGSDAGYKFLPRENPKRATLRLTYIGDIKIQLHRPLEGKIKGYIILKEESQWFVCFSCELPANKKLPLSYEDVGIDVGIAQFAALSDGSFIENPRYYRQAEQNLAKLQQSLSRKKKKGIQGSKGERRKKAIRLVAKAHRKIRNQRKDFLHKESRKLVNRFQIIAHEDLKIKNMSKRPKPKQDEETGQYLPNNASAKSGLNKSILDASWGTFTSMIEAKAESAGRIIKPVPAMYTSQTCSQCGHISTDNRKSQAEFECVKCGYINNADTNAAINILRKSKEV